MPYQRTGPDQRDPADTPAGIRLVAFDLDGTLTRGQTCMEAIADVFGFAAQMSVWEQSRTEQELIAARLGMWEYLKHLSLGDMEAALAGIPLAPGAIEGITALRTAGIATVIVSLAHAPNVAYFAGRLGVDAHFGSEPDGNGGYRHVFPATKPTLLAEYASALDIPAEQIAAVGDTPNDVPMLRAARISIYVGTTLPDDFTPTWHLPAASIDEISRIILEPATRATHNRTSEARTGLRAAPAIP
ncbi:HAD-IB family phosphatase [Micromonospora sp. NPDC049523]|uniref:HAD family hydrolase n=1 Tax=Micromonospora sp. NPDC049523 TaxID=3155921 RepID=UPI0034285770